MISDRGIELIKLFEGCKLEAYPDPATGGEPWTIGVGTTGGVKPGDTCTLEQAIEWLKDDVEHADRAVTELVEVDLNQNQRDALISFIYNVGEGNFKSSTLLKLLNQGNYHGAAQQFLRWNKAAGKVMKGLTHRRIAEADLFLEPV